MIEPLKQTSKSAYTSCIKIAGVPILPPLMTIEKRIELDRYKKKAVDIERRLKCERDLKLFIKRLPDPILNEIPPNNSRTVIKTLENLLTFGDGDDSHVDALTVSDKSSDSKLPSDECKTCVPLKEQNQKPSKLTCNIVDVTQYSDEGVVIFNDCNKTGEINQINGLSASMVELDLTSLGSMDNLSMCNNNEDLKGSPKPRLLRSNSYTLESPSPVLLEHFKKQAQFEPEKYLGQQQRSLSSESYLATSANVQNQQPVIIKPTVPDRNIENDKCYKHISTDILQGCDVPVESMNEIVENLAQLHFGASNPVKPYENPQEKDLIETPCLEVQKRGEAIHDKIVEAEAALHEVLNDMPESCAKDIMDLLERHKLNQALQLESYTKFKQKLLDEHANSNSMSQSESNLDTSEPKEQDLISLYDEESKSCTIHCLTNTSTDSSHLLNESISLIDFENDTDQFEPADHFNVLSRTTNYQRSRESRGSNCSRELFVEKPDKVQRRLQEQWAAMILTSTAKGYLVRRLKRTERVRNLIQTIRDAVMCAMSLHSEETECIQSSDVELHRRLIQQISAACFEFYHIFFGLSTKEQMDMIALDRQKLQEKLKRPRSSSSVKLDAKKSTPTVPKQSFNAQQKKLSPSFAA